MKFCFRDMKPLPDEEGWAPDFPDGTSFGLLASPGRRAPWGVYRYELEDPDSTWKPEHPVSDELKALLYSGERYPPALALAREDMTVRFEGESPSREEFGRAYVAALRRRIERQWLSGAVLVQVVVDGGIDLAEGEWYWVLGASRSQPGWVRWVSDDYFVYESPAQHFDLVASDGGSA